MSTVSGNCPSNRLTAAELKLVPDRTEHGRLGFAVLFKSLQSRGRFPTNRDEV